MTVVKKKVVKKPETSLKKESSKKAISLSLPTKKAKPETDLSAFTWLIYGEKKIGKTSLCAEFEKSLIMEFEPGAKALEAYRMDVPDWETAREIKELLISENHEFKNIVIDTGKIAYDRCLMKVSEEESVSHPSEGDYGKVWSSLNNEFHRFHLDMQNRGLGLVIIAHEISKERESYSGMKYTTLEPDLSSSSLSFYHGAVDTIARYSYFGKDRFLTIRGDENIVAGTRCGNNFLTPDGKPIRHIPMGKSAKEAMQNLIKAFNNKQIETYEDLGKRESLKKDTPVKTIKKKARV